jgi:hypothetical protein
MKLTLQAMFHLLTIDLTYINLRSIVGDENHEIQRYQNHSLGFSVFCWFLISCCTEGQVAMCYKMLWRYNTELNSCLSNKRQSRIKASPCKAVIKQDLSVPFVICVTLFLVMWLSLCKDIYRMHKYFSPLYLTQSKYIKSAVRK